MFSMTLEAKEYEFDNVIEDVKKVSEKPHGYFKIFSRPVSIESRTCQGFTVLTVWRFIKWSCRMDSNFYTNCMFHLILISEIILFRKSQQSQILLLMPMILNLEIFKCNYSLWFKLPCKKRFYCVTRCITNPTKHQTPLFLKPDQTKLLLIHSLSTVLIYRLATKISCRNSPISFVV